MSDHENSFVEPAPPHQIKESEKIISPSCVIEEGNQAHPVLEAQQMRLKENPNLISASLGVHDIVHKQNVSIATSSSPDVLLEKSYKSVSFSNEVVEHEPSIEWDLEDFQAMWWTSNEIQSFHKAARAKANAFLRRNKRFKETFHAVFQDCSKEISGRELLSAQSVQDLLSSATALRGLESRVIGVVREYRNFHIRNVLDVAANHEVDAIVRSRSLRTSRPSRSLAKILARQDYMAIAHMIRKELDGEPPSPSSSSSNEATISDAAGGGLPSNLNS